MMHTPLENYDTITRFPSLRVIISTNVPLDMKRNVCSEKDLSNAAGLFLYLQNEAGYDIYTEKFAGIHD
jgi:hypothetical protein